MTHDLATERALLGGLIREPDRLADLGDLAGCWLSPEHEALYRLIRSMLADGEPVDSVTLPLAAVRHGGPLVGSAAYVARLRGECPSTANLGHYATEVRSMATTRRALALLDEAGEQVTAGGPAAVEDLAARLLAAVEGGEQGALVSVGETAEEDLRVMLEDPPGCISTGLAALDELLAGGLEVGKLTILAGRPAMGKSAVAETIELAAAEAGWPVAACVMEGGRELRYRRLISRRSTVWLHRIRTRDLEAWHHLRMARAAHDIAAMATRWHWQCGSAQTLDDVVRHARRVRRTHGDLGLVVVDYVQLMGLARGERRQALGAAVNGLAGLALDLQCHVLCLSQLNRDVEKRGNKRPQLSDLHEAGELEMAADTVIGLYRDGYYNEASEAPDEIEAIVLKQREGRTGTARLGWDGRTVSVSDLAPVVAMDYTEAGGM